MKNIKFSRKYANKGSQITESLYYIKKITKIITFSRKYNNKLELLQKPVCNC